MVWGTFFGDEVPQSARSSAGGVQKLFGQCPNAFVSNFNGASLTILIATKHDLRSPEVLMTHCLELGVFVVE